MRHEADSDVKTCESGSNLRKMSNKEMVKKRTCVPGVVQLVPFPKQKHKAYSGWLLSLDNDNTLHDRIRKNEENKTFFAILGYFLNINILAQSQLISLPALGEARILTKDIRTGFQDPAFSLLRKHLSKY